MNGCRGLCQRLAGQEGSRDVWHFRMCSHLSWGQGQLLCSVTPSWTEAQILAAQPILPACLALRFRAAARPHLAGQLISRVEAGHLGPEIGKKAGSRGWEDSEPFVGARRVSTCMLGKPWTSLFFLTRNSTKLLSVSPVYRGCAWRPVLGTEERLCLKIKANLAAWSACPLNALAYIKQTRVIPTRYIQLVGKQQPALTGSLLRAIVRQAPHPRRRPYHTACEEVAKDTAAQIQSRRPGFHG